MYGAELSRYRLMTNATTITTIAQKIQIVITQPVPHLGAGFGFGGGIVEEVFGAKVVDVGFFVVLDDVVGTNVEVVGFLVVLEVVVVTVLVGTVNGSVVVLEELDGTDVEVDGSVVLKVVVVFVVFFFLSMLYSVVLKTSCTFSTEIDPLTK